MIHRFLGGQPRCGELKHSKCKFEVKPSVSDTASQMLLKPKGNTTLLLLCKSACEDKKSASDLVGGDFSLYQWGQAL